MQGHELLQLMATLQLSGMRAAAFDEIVADGLRRQHAFDQMLGALLQAEVAEKRARSIRYQMGAARLPLAKTAEDFRFAGRPINEERALQDPTGGAVRYHELGASPAWATRLNPSACIGSYLFYDDVCGDEEDRKSPADTESASGPPAGAQPTTEPRGGGLRTE